MEFFYIIKKNSAKFKKSARSDASKSSSRLFFGDI